MFFDYHIPTKILFGKGKLDELATVELPGKKALIVITGGTAMTKFGYLERVQTLLNKNEVDSVTTNSIKGAYYLKNSNGVGVNLKSLSEIIKDETN